MVLAMDGIEMIVSQARLNRGSVYTLHSVPEKHNVLGVASDNYLHT